MLFTARYAAGDKWLLNLKQSCHRRITFKAEQNSSSLLLGHHTLDIEYKGVLSTGVDSMLVGNRVSVVPLGQ